jgi:acetoin utilization deacetylase AcuC-like enzyme
MNDLVFFYPEGHEAHFEPGHPERPERIETIRQALEAAGWWEEFPRLDPLELSQDTLQAVHTPGYLENLQAASRLGLHLDADTYTTPASWELAKKAAGGASAVAAAVWERRARRGLALTRPPGHHATPGRGMGFCLLNNVALAVTFLRQSSGAKRLAIVDLDLHHGNGTQDIFWHDKDIFYLSTHQSPLYPGSGALEETGEGDGRGATANFPLPPGSGDRAFASLMPGLILPLLDRFGPEMLLVSLGFDPHWRDPLGSLLLSAGVLGELIGSLTAWADEHCQGRIALFLEGGYDLQAGTACVLASVAALLGRPFQDPLGPAPYPESTAWMAMARSAARLWGLPEVS